MADYALLVGIDAYNDHHPLNTPVNDVEAIAQMLSRDADGRARWHGKPMVGAKKSGVRVTESVLTEALKDRLGRAADSKGNFLLYFAGHGVKVSLPLGGHSHNIVLQGEAKDDPDTLLDLGPVLKYVLDDDGPNSITIVLDACFAGGAVDASNYALGGNRAILTSSRDEALDGQGTHSPFARYVLESLDGTQAPLTGEVTITNLFEYVSRRFGPEAQGPRLRVNLDAEPVVLRAAERLIVPGNLEELFPMVDARVTMSWDHEGPVHLVDHMDESCRCPERSPHHHARPYHRYPQFEPTKKQEQFDELRRLYRLGMIMTHENWAPYDLVDGGKDLWLSPLGQWYWHQRDLGWL